jgi:hypothetical protein
MASGSLEYNVESALILLLNGDPMLFELGWRHSEFSGDREPTPEGPGNLRNPNGSVKCTKGGVAIPQSCYYNIDAEIRLWVDVDEATVGQGIDQLFHLIECIMDDPALHLTINVVPANNRLFICEGTRQRKDVRLVGGGRFDRKYQMQLICVAKV